MLSAPVTSLSPAQQRTFATVTGAALFVLLCWMAWLRWVRPQWPVDDPDTWGYLHPAISKLLGGPFEHTYGRNFVYPGWIYLILAATNDFRAISVVQHALGLVVPVLIWLIWREWRAWFATSRLPAWVDAALGLGLAAFFGAASSVIHYEEQIRPESIFAFFAALDLWLLLVFIRVWYRERRSQRAAVWAGLTLFATAVVYQLKPSFGLAAVFVAPPLGLALFVPGQQGAWRPRLRLLGAFAAGGLAVAVLLVLPERSFARGDPLAATFLPETLLTVHARIIRDQMNEDVRDGAETPYSVAWLTWTSRYLDGEVRRASDPAQLPYATLGYNPDYLMYRDSFCRWIGGQLPPAQIASFCYYYYSRAWTHHPGMMLGKIVNELGQFYSFHCPAFRSSTRLFASEYYRKTLEFLMQPSYHGQILLYPRADEYLEAVQHLAKSDAVFRTPPLLILADLIASVVHLLLLVLFLAGIVAVAFLPRGHRRMLWKAAAVLLLLYGICFGNCLTVALVHSLSIHRYSLNLLLYAAFCEAATVAWLAEVYLFWRAGRPVVGRAAPVTIPFTGPSRPGTGD